MGQVKHFFAFFKFQESGSKKRIGTKGLIFVDFNGIDGASKGVNYSQKKGKRTKAVKK